MVPTGGSEGESVPCLFPSFWWLSETLGVPQLVDTSLESLPLSSHDVLPVYLCLNFLLFLRTPLIGLGRVHYFPGPHLNLIISAKTLSPNKVPVTGTGA